MLANANANANAFRGELTAEALLQRIKAEREKMKSVKRGRKNRRLLDARRSYVVRWRPIKKRPQTRASNGELRSLLL
ncbi:hypothetical protein Ga0074115_10456 [endosymbiont of Ridgeia piscesae]|jgi:hypothetical protein|uniref:Uncharacterized protein n=1 Tax=endosymbiont of Ridgeia piscesae TaxID=54398 RepID=A0A0T5ZBV0_9GAMM|nr:hypothetical protein Ga0074115_10456 [endosymbiont of Ridgeia piscesae]KRT60313.1 hypothetical protein Ga0076813_169316 [endosymbiont of Ridgeia piscesae]